MRILCKIGRHAWTTKATARPGTTVSRCPRCGAVKVTHAKSLAARNTSR